MSQKSIILIVTLFVLIVVGMFIYASLMKAELKQIDPIDNSALAVVEVESPYSDVTRVDAKHYYIDGLHTLVGEINLPTPCDLLVTEVAVMESFPEQVIVDLSVINNADTCDQVVTSQRFKVEFEASDRASISTKFQDEPIELNLITAAQGESPDDFELFIKG